MIAGKVPGFVGDHALDFVWRFGEGEKACVDAHIAPARKGVEGGIVDDDDLDGVGVKAGRPKNRPRIIFQPLFDLRVAQG